MFYDVVSVMFRVKILMDVLVFNFRHCPDCPSQHHGEGYICIGSALQKVVRQSRRVVEVETKHIQRMRNIVCWT